MATSQTQTTNKVLFDTIRDLKKASNSTGLAVFRAVAQKLSAPASQRPEVNISRLEKHTKDGESVIVAGKVLGDGTLSKKLKVIAFSATEGAKKKIQSAGGEFVEIREYLKKKPDGKLRIIA